jgi:hypothetical protein
LTAEEIAGYVTEVQQAGDAILNTVEGLPTSIALPAETAEVILDLLAGMATTAFAAWGAARGVPITVESIQGLLPNPTPLTPPDPV